MNSQLLKKLNEKELKDLSSKLNDLIGAQFGNPLQLRKHEQLMASLFGVKDWSTALGMTSNSDEKETMLLASTGNITESDLRRLEDSANSQINKESFSFYPLSVMNYQYGVTVSVPLDWEISEMQAEIEKFKEYFSEAFINLLWHCRKKGYQWINFDQDNCHIEGFPEFEW